ncbi:hypothetical protein [Actinocatenispora rupis]|uniref:hypothetical protein n=1 Tax=Actinocatenispora rupis TaxID=519421 RepID=UPI001EF22F03|nr:hypothetical protein [Actinocatenispora rupis]
MSEAIDPRTGLQYRVDWLMHEAVVVGPRRPRHFLAEFLGGAAGAFGTSFGGVFDGHTGVLGSGFAELLRTVLGEP